MRRTVCGRGHDLTDPANVYDYPPPNEGKRQCYVCNTGAPRRGPQPLATHCGRGHKWNEENTYVYPSGARSCRACHREWRRARRASKKAL